MGTKPGEQMMGQLERRAEAVSVDFNAQAVSGLFWPYATLSISLSDEIMLVLEDCANSTGVIRALQARQVLCIL
jgi:hypothetical protein